ncbi:MAG: hypothetical protein AAGD35_01075 [Actinomycetota bacterium]
MIAARFRCARPAAAMAACAVVALLAGCGQEATADRSASATTAPTVASDLDGDASEATTTSADGPADTASTTDGPADTIDPTTSSTAVTPETTAGRQQSGGSSTIVGCTAGPIPDVAGLDPFYVQGCRIQNFWVVAGEPVDPAAVEAAADLVSAFFEADPLLGRVLADSGVRLGVIGAEQRTTDMPEYRDLYEAFPDVDWDNESRGLGATADRPLVSAGEENVLCLAGDAYRGEDILLHEFAHVLHLQGFAVIDPGFQPALDIAYRQAMDAGTWDNTYAATNAEEYWAEGVQSYFGRNRTSDPPDGVHGPVSTRSALRTADPDLYRLIDNRLERVVLPQRCP